MHICKEMLNEALKGQAGALEELNATPNEAIKIIAHNIIGRINLLAQITRDFSKNPGAALAVFRMLEKHAKAVMELIDLDDDDCEKCAGDSEQAVHH